jgi:hypothetical protein
MWERQPESECLDWCTRGKVQIARSLSHEKTVESFRVSLSLNKGIEVGKLLAHEIGRSDGKVLVELPRKSTSGTVRVWG